MPLERARRRRPEGGREKRGWIEGKKGGGKRERKEVETNEIGG